MLSLLIFGGLAVYFYADLEALLPKSGADSSEFSDDGPDVSGQVSNTSSGGEITLPPDVDHFAPLSGLFVAKNSRGEVTKALFLRFQPAKRQILTCQLPLNLSVYNEVGSLVPLRDFLRYYSGEQAAQAIVALTGFAADFYLELTPEALPDMVENMQTPGFFVQQEIRYVNPIYAGTTFGPTDTLPVDYQKTVPSGQIILDREKVQAILMHYQSCDGSDGHETYDRLLDSLYTSLLDQMLNAQREVMLDSPEQMARAYAGADTNLTAEFLRGHAELLYRYGGEDAYTRKALDYTTRDAMIHLLKEEDRGNSDSAG